MNLALLYCLAATGAAGTPVVNVATETDLISYSLPVGALAKGKVIKGRAVVRSIDENSTNTLTLKLKIGGTTVYTSASVDQADDDVSVIDFEIVSRGTGAAATIIVSGWGVDPDATGTLAPKAFAKVYTVDTTAAVAIAITATYSAAHADNECQIESFTLYEG